MGCTFIRHLFGYYDQCTNCDIISNEVHWRTFQHIKENPDYNNKHYATISFNGYLCGKCFERMEKT